MKRIFIHGVGAVSSAGWGIGALRAALEGNTAIAPTPVARPGWPKPIFARRVPSDKSSALNHPRLRRCSPMSVFAAAAAKEALADAGIANPAEGRLGIVFCVTGGCVQFSRRFYEEAWRDPATASPVVFPETVFNAPSSHLGAMLDLESINYTMVGDPGTFLQGLALAAQWLVTGKTDNCLVVGAEELDWVTADACRHFAHQSICSEGAGALVLSCSSPASETGAELIAVTDSHLYVNNVSRVDVINKMRGELPMLNGGTLLCDSRQGTFRDRAETTAWSDWTSPRLSPRSVLGDGLMAGAGWQCTAVVDQLRRGRHQRAIVCAAGGHQQAIGACFGRV